MPLIECPECGSKRSNHAWFCPQCGKPDLDRLSQDLMGLSLKVFLLLLLVGLLLIVAAALAPVLLSGILGTGGE